MFDMIGISINELRIGNSILQGEVDAIHSDGTIEVLKNKNRSAIELLYAEPVPLTLEVLEQCGFEHVEGDIYAIRHANGFGFYIFNDVGIVSQLHPKSSTPDTLEFYSAENKNYEVIGDEMFFLHELQNRFYSFTKCELRFKPPNVIQFYR